MKFTITLILLLIVSSVSAQKVLNARIISKAKKESISYASVVVRNNPSKGVSSNAEGWFRLECNQNDTLSIQCIGYKIHSLLAADVFIEPLIELDEDTISLNEVFVTAESAYNMLFRVRDNTVKHQMKLFQGYCLRKDELLLNDNTERISDSEIIFKSRKTKNEQIGIDYWLRKHTMELFFKSPHQPRISYPNTIPFFPSHIRKLSTNAILNVNCTMKSKSDSILVINVKRKKPTKNMIDDCYYYVNKKTWLFDCFECKGDSRNKPIKKRGLHFYNTNFKFSYTTNRDSIILANFNFNTVFSNKEADTQNLWNYRVNMEVVPTNVAPEIRGKKLRKIDYLLYKD